MLHDIGAVLPLLMLCLDFGTFRPFFKRLQGAFLLNASDILLPHHREGLGD